VKHPGIFRQAHVEGMTLIRTAIANAVNTRRLAEFAADGVAAVEWVAVRDEATTDICLGLDGLQWTMPEDPEDYEGYIPIGHDVPFPGPIAHWSCRSAQIPVTREEDAVTAGSMLATSGQTQ
jgi:hypothetical protein